MLHSLTLVMPLAPKQSSFIRYKNAVEFLEGLRTLPEAVTAFREGENPPYLERTRFLLEKVGNPDRNLKIIHVTGTAGKGTVSTLTQAMLSKSGKKTGLFTSPYATTFAEKISIDGVLISADACADIIETLKPVLDEVFVTSPFGPPSYFEILFVLVMLYFAQQGCEWAVVEVGLGGRFDATNVIDPPVASAITVIDFDHMRFLGETLQEIAWNKAGIIKKGSVFFTSETRPELRTYFEKECRKEGAQFNLVEGDNYRDRNLALARQLVKVAGVEDSEITDVVVPARFEQVQTSPRVILDGAHNPIKIRSTMYNISQLTYRKLILVTAFADDKEVEVMVEELFPLADILYSTRISSATRVSHSPLSLFHFAQKYGKPDAEKHLRLDAEQALEEALERAHSDDLIVVTGSFFLAGLLRKRWYSEEWVLENRKVR